MCQCQAYFSCHGCHHGAVGCEQHSVDRRRFLRGFATATTAAGLASLCGGADQNHGKVRVAAVFLANTNFREIWPYPGFDAAGRQREILALLAKGCPQVEFVPVTVLKGADVQKAVAMKDEVDGYLVYVMTLDWGLGAAAVRIGQLGKPMLLANEFLGGCGVFLTRYGELCSRKLPAGAVSSTRLDDLVAVARQFATVRRPGTTPASFARQCDEAYRKTFAALGEMKCVEDPLSLTEIGECVKQFKQSRFLIIGRGSAGQERDFLGMKARYIDFDELGALYEKVDRDEAGEWARQWTKQGEKLPDAAYVEPARPTPEAVDKAGGVYLALLKLLKKYGTDNVTMDCLGGFAAGKLPAYPCLGYRQLLDDGAQGVCEAMPDDTLSTMMARILTGRPGFVSDPALDTSKNEIVYAHCVATTRPFGPQGDAAEFRIRTLHNRDPRGACAEAMLPAGYMTTSFRTNVARKQLVVHRARSAGTLESEHGCRTKLIAKVHGDVGKLFHQWRSFGWHRVTVYGDVQEPLAEFGKALGLEVVEEA